MRVREKREPGDIWVQFSVKVPIETREKLDREAERQHRSRNSVINRILKEKLEPPTGQCFICENPDCRYKGKA